MVEEKLPEKKGFGEPQVMEDTTLIDMRLWLAVQESDYAAFEKLFHKYYSLLCRYSEGFVGSRVQAEDIVQDTFIYFWEKRGLLEMKVSVVSCLYTAVRYRSLRTLENQIRLQRHSPQMSEYFDHLLKSEYSEEEEREIERIRAMMQELPPQCLKVFVMNTLEGKKYTEIAAELSISVNTVKTHVTKAYKIIREQLRNDESSAIFLFLTYRNKFLE